MPEFESHGLTGGVWSGLLRIQGPAPARVVLTQLGSVVARAVLTQADERCWHVAITLPATVLSDGNHSFLLIADDMSGDAADDPAVGPGAVHLGRLNLVAGAPLDDDLATEIQVLRAEIELLKREFRRLATGA